MYVYIVRQRAFVNVINVIFAHCLLSASVACGMRPFFFLFANNVGFAVSMFWITFSCIPTAIICLQMFCLKKLTHVHDDFVFQSVTER